MVTLWKNLPEKTSNYTHKEFQRHRLDKTQVAHKMEVLIELNLFLLRKQTKGDEPLPILPPGMNTKFVNVIPPGTIHNR